MITERQRKEKEKERRREKKNVIPNGSLCNQRENRNL